MNTNNSLPYISGMSYRALCDFYYDEFQKFNPSNEQQFDGMKFFIKTDLVGQFEQIILPLLRNKFYVYCHNSDLNAPSSLNLLNHPLLIHCFSQNANFVHPNLSSIPIGIANSHWPHGDIKALKEVQSLNIKKDNLVYCNFSTKTNIKARAECLRHAERFNQCEKKPFKDYLQDIDRSFFCISPEGNGIDCHRNWECFYLKTVPIVTESVNINFYKSYPFLILKNWSDFSNLNFTESLYKKLWENFDEKLLYINND